LIPIVAAIGKRPRPGSAANTDDILKLHRHHIVLNGQPHTVVTLRPQADVRGRW
jgi:hypothetical protein